MKWGWVNTTKAYQARLSGFRMIF